MKLSTKYFLWKAAILIFVSINSLLTIFSVWELRLTDRLTAEDYEIALSIRQVRDKVVEYYISKLETNSIKPKKYSDFSKTQKDLFESLKKIQPSIQSLRLQQQLELTKQEIQSLLIRESEKDPGLKNLGLNFETILGHLDALADESAKRVTVDRAWNESLARKLAYAAASMFIVVLVISIAAMVLLRKTVLLPIQGLIETVKQVKAGNFSARWENDRPLDEIGAMGQTINETVAELEFRRTERIRMIGSIVHDLKNPLTTIGLNCDLLISKGSEISHENAIHLVKRVHSQIHRLKRMLDDLLNAATAATPGFDLKLTQFNLEKLASETLDLFKGSHPNRKYTLITSENEDFEITADQDRISQVLTNLLSNATKYSDASTEIELVVHKVGDQFQIEVLDRGIGIPEDKLQNIFKPFIRLEEGRNMSSGFGLGLATVEGIIKAHSGQIIASRREGGGMSFRILLNAAG